MSASSQPTEYYENPIRRMIYNTWRLTLFELGVGQQSDFFLYEKYYLNQVAYNGLCLDFGAGSGFFTRFLKTQGHRVIPVDVVNKSSYSDVQPILYDGHQLPFACRYFDTTLCMFVLHHVSHQEKIIKELKRVTKKMIIIAEDLVETWFDIWFTAIHTHKSPWSKSFSGFKSETEWEKYFKQHKLTVINKIVIPRYITPYYPIRRVVYSVQIEDAAF